MYKCANCEHVFSEPEIETEDYGYNVDLGFRSAVQEFEVCPACGSECFTTAVLCCECGEYFFKEELVDSYICGDCFERRTSDD